ncbi:hypothetical protein Q5O14_16275 [Eubacteriaceae bacterium ES2]|nr:hypothetical protein Q5O14_16275 [Eubacteriaceae bacterium ES2]
MQIKLGNTTYDTGKLTGAALWESLEFEELVKAEKSKIKQLNMMAEQVVKLYGNQFTVEDIKNGLEAHETWGELNAQCFGVGFKLAEKVNVKNE